MIADACAYRWLLDWIFFVYFSHGDVMLVLVVGHSHYGHCHSRPGEGGGNAVLAVPFAVLRRPMNPRLMVGALAFGFVGLFFRLS